MSNYFKKIIKGEIKVLNYKDGWYKPIVRKTVHTQIREIAKRKHVRIWKVYNEALTEYIEKTNKNI